MAKHDAVIVETIEISLKDGRSQSLIHILVLAPSISSSRDHVHVKIRRNPGIVVKAAYDFTHGRSINLEISINKWRVAIRTRANVSVWDWLLPRRALGVVPVRYNSDETRVRQVRIRRVVVGKWHYADIGIDGWWRDSWAAFIAGREYVRDYASRLVSSSHDEAFTQSCLARTALVQSVDLALILSQHIRLVRR